MYVTREINEDFLNIYIASSVLRSFTPSNNWHSKLIFVIRFEYTPVVKCEYTVCHLLANTMLCFGCSNYTLPRRRLNE